MDVNVSLVENISGHPNSSTSRCELKNLASLRHIHRGINAEILRQLEIVSQAPKAIQTIPKPPNLSDCSQIDSLEPSQLNSIGESTTRFYDPKLDITVASRTKDGGLEYRFMPEADLPDLLISNELIRQLTASMPPLPDVQFKRLTLSYGLSAKLADSLMNIEGASVFFESVVSHMKSSAFSQSQNPNQTFPLSQNTKQSSINDSSKCEMVAHWLVNIVQGLLSKSSDGEQVERSGWGFLDCTDTAGPLRPVDVAWISASVLNGKIPIHVGRELMETMLGGEKYDVTAEFLLKTVLMNKDKMETHLRHLITHQLIPKYPSQLQQLLQPGKKQHKILTWVSA